MLSKFTNLVGQLIYELLLMKCQFDVYWAKFKLKWRYSSFAPAENQTRKESCIISKITTPAFSRCPRCKLTFKPSICTTNTFFKVFCEDTFNSYMQFGSIVFIMVTFSFSNKATDWLKIEVHPDELLFQLLVNCDLQYFSLCDCLNFYFSIQSTYSVFLKISG